MSTSLIYRDGAPDNLLISGKYSKDFLHKYLIIMNSQLNQAVILAGGRGERLRPLTDTIPKPMAPIYGVPFMDYLIYSVVQVGISKILILLGYKADVIADRYRDIKNILFKVLTFGFIFTRFEVVRADKTRI